MTWDSQNRMTSCTFQGTTSTFTYGADGLRRSETVNGVTTYYAYDGTTLIREMHKNVQTGALYNTATYLTGPRGPEYRRDDTQQEYDSQHNLVSKTRWYVYDGLGSVVGEVDPSGNLTSSPKYDVYGLVRQNPGTASSAMGFVGGLGHLSEAGTGLIYMRARYYDPSLGRFCSEDPIGHGLNWFIYCNNNPITGSDPTGLAAEGIMDGETQYNLNDIKVGFGALAGVLAIITGYLATEQCAADGIFLAEQKKREKTSQAGQKQWWDAALKRHGLTQEDGRELHQEGISSRNGYSQDEIEAEMERLANDKYGGDEQ